MIILKLLYTLVPTILIELGVLLILAEKRKKVLWASVIINILTNVPLNLYLRLVHNSWTEIVIGELTVLIVETIWYFLFLREWKKAFVYSLLCNAISFLVGILFQMIVIYIKLN